MEVWIGIVILCVLMIYAGIHEHKSRNTPGPPEEKKVPRWPEDAPDL